MTPLFVAIVLAFFLTPLVRAIALRAGAIDRPNERSSHAVPTPRGGGVAILFAMIVALAVAVRVDEPVLLLLAGTLAIALLGLVDDLRSLPPSIRFGVQTIVAIVVAMRSARVEALVPDERWVIGSLLASVALTVFWVVGLTNAYNFMDGINGIASVQGIVAGLALAAMFARGGDDLGAILGLAAAGACAGFLPWNFPKARIFMGDVGSGALGFLFAFLACRLSMGGGSMLEGALPLLPFVFDTTITLVRRVAAGEKWWTAHRSHLYQRLNQSGWSHAEVTMLWGALAVVSSAGAIALEGLRVGGQIAIVVGLVVVHSALALWILARWRRIHPPLSGQP